jgi:uncharacterized protein
VKLARALDAKVEDCVNAVGVDVNTASAPLLARVAGLSSSVAENVVKFRDANGAFRTREQLKKVPRLGDKAFEQCAGFLRVPRATTRSMPRQCIPRPIPWWNASSSSVGREVKC